MNRTQRNVIISIIAILVIVAGVVYLRPSRQTPTPNSQPAESVEPTDNSRIQVPVPTTTEPSETPNVAEEILPVQTPPREITIESGFPYFRPATLTLKKGEPVRLTINNTGTHTFTIDELGVNATLTNGTQVVEFTPDKVGTFAYYCAVAGHRLAGQVGTLTVTE